MTAHRCPPCFYLNLFFLVRNLYITQSKNQPRIQNLLYTFSPFFQIESSMKECNVSWVFLISFFFLFFDPSSSHLLNSTAEYHHGHTAISDFRVINRRELDDCPDLNPYLEVNISSNSALSNEEYVTVTVSGVLLPAESDWIGMISPSHSE